MAPYFYIYIHVYAHRCLYMACVYTRHSLVSTKVMTSWHHRNLGSTPPYFTWEAGAPQEIWALHPGAVATLELSWPCEMVPTTTQTSQLGSSGMMWGTSTILAVCSAPPSWIPLQRPPGPVGTFLGTGSGPSQALWIQPSHPHSHNWHHSVSL